MDETLRTLRRNIESVRDEIRNACERSGREPSDVFVLPIVKYVGADLVRQLHACGLDCLGESTIQGTLRKLEELSDLAALRWQLVGHLQRNKVKKALELYEAIHSLDSLRLARAIDQRLEPDRRLDLFVEVNIGGEETKAGVAPEKLVELLDAIRRETRLADHLVGLMTVAPYAESPEDARPHFRRLRELRDDCIDRRLLPESAGLSMGMSGDFPVAVEEGATVVRVGSRFFDGIERR